MDGSIWAVSARARFMSSVSGGVKKSKAFVVLPDDVVVPLEVDSCLRSEIPNGRLCFQHVFSKLAALVALGGQSTAVCVILARELLPSHFDKSEVGQKAAKRDISWDNPSVQLTRAVAE